MYVELLYAYSEELASLLWKDENVRNRTSDIIEGLIPDIRAFMEGEEMGIASEMRMHIEILLENVQLKASPSLKSVISRLQKDMNDYSTFNMLGRVSAP